MLRGFWLETFAIGLIGLLLAAGCSPAKVEPKKEAAPAAEKKAAESPATSVAESTPAAKPAATKPAASAVTAPPAKAADAAVLAVLEGMRTNHPEALWEFLPATMQENLNEAFREIGRSADADVWNRSAGLLKKIVEIFEKKKEFILASPFWKTAEKVDPKQIDSHWDDLVGLLSSIAESDLSSVERLKEFDGRKFLSDSGGKFLTHLQKLAATVKGNSLADLKNVKVTLKSQTGNDAVVTIEAPGQPAADHEFTVIEGKWCPKAWAEIQPRLAALKDGVKAFLTSENITKQKEPIMQELDQIETGIDQLLETKTAQDFNDLIAQRVLPYLLVRGSSFGIGGGPAAAPPSGAEAGTVTVIVTPKVDDKKAQELLDKLAELSDNKNQSVVFGPNAIEGGQEFTVTPVADAEAFSKKIAFATVTNVDRDKKTITVKLSDAK